MSERVPALSGPPYDASTYLGKNLDYIVLCDITLSAADRNASVAAFFDEVQNGAAYRLEESFVSSFEGFHVAQWLGWPMHADWQYTRPNLWVYARKQTSDDTEQTPEHGP